MDKIVGLGLTGQGRTGPLSDRLSGGAPWRAVLHSHAGIMYLVMFPWWAMNRLQLCFPGGLLIDCNSIFLVMLVHYVRMTATNPILPPL